MTANDTNLSIEDAKALIQTELENQGLNDVLSFCTPLFWVNSEAKVNQQGTAFFINTGERCFGVTAAHVVDAWLASTDGSCLHLAANGSSFGFKWQDREIDKDPEIDIATFRISVDEVQQIGKEVLSGSPIDWPPKLPKVDCDLLLGGYPGSGTRHSTTGEFVFGAFTCWMFATSVSEVVLTTQVERGNLVPTIAGGIPPENFDFGGISGGPVLTFVEGKSRMYELAGVIYEGPNVSVDPQQAISGFELIRARPASFIRPDGTLDRLLWKTLRP